MHDCFLTCEQRFISSVGESALDCDMHLRVMPSIYLFIQEAFFAPRSPHCPGDCESGPDVIHVTACDCFLYNNIFVFFEWHRQFANGQFKHQTSNKGIMRRLPKPEAKPISKPRLCREVGRQDFTRFDLPAQNSSIS